MNHKKYLQFAVEQAKESVVRGGFPAGAVIVKNNSIIATGISIGNVLNDPTAHAETDSIRNACKEVGSVNLKNSILYASIKPCLMCFSAANWAGISKIIYGYEQTEDMISKDYYEGKTDINKVNIRNNRKISLIYIQDFKNEIEQIVSNWEKDNAI